MYLVTCPPLCIVFLRQIHAGTWSSGLLIFPEAQCPIHVYTPLSLSRGFPQLVCHQRSQGHSCLSWADEVTLQAEDQPRSKKTEPISEPRASTLHPNPGSVIRAMRSTRSRASTLEREHRYLSLFYHFGLSEQSEKFWPHLTAGFSTQLREPHGLEGLTGGRRRHQ